MKLPADCLQLPNTNTPGRAHLIGAGGAGMRALAEVLRGRGWVVTGWDDGLRGPEAGDTPWVETERLPEGLDVVVYSGAIADDHPQRIAARMIDAPVVSYARMLGHLGQSGRLLAVAGTHGKSTTVAMAGEILHAAGLDPTIVCGASPLGATSGGRAGRGELVLIEACEYRRNFLHLHPEAAALLPIEADHFDCFATMRDVREAFAALAANLSADGLLLASADCPVASRIAAETSARVITFGVASPAAWTVADACAAGAGSRFTLLRQGRRFADVVLAVPGEHNVANALAAATLAHEAAGATPQQVAAGLARFRGLARRLEHRATCGGVEFYDDYAHHPTEVAAGLRTLRQLHPESRLWCVFQPHQASRTAALLDEFAAVLQNADVVVVAEIFAARETHAAATEVTAEDLARRVTRIEGRGARDEGDSRVLDVHRAEEIVVRLQSALSPGDVIVTMGAGDLWKVGDELIKRFGTFCEARRAAGGPHVAESRWVG